MSPQVICDNELDVSNYQRECAFHAARIRKSRHTKGFVSEFHAKFLSAIAGLVGPVYCFTTLQGFNESLQEILVDDCELTKMVWVSHFSYLGR